MKHIDDEVPVTADTFRIVPVVLLVGRATRIPVEWTDQAEPIEESRVRILHIVMSEKAFCAWRS